MRNLFKRLVALETHRVEKGQQHPLDVWEVDARTGEKKLLWRVENSLADFKEIVIYLDRSDNGASTA